MQLEVTLCFDAKDSGNVFDWLRFGYSGYVLGDYLDVHEQINGVRAGELERSAEALALSKMFSGAIPFEETPTPFPEFDEQALRAFCRSEYANDADSMREAIQAAHEFYLCGLARLSEAHVVAFLIQ